MHLPNNKENNNNNNEKKGHIEALYRKRARNDPNSVTLANTLDVLIDTALKGDNKYIYELLQNADDAAKNSHLHVDIILTSNHLIVMHDGEHFSAVDMEKITDNATRNYQDKSQNKDKIGYKGIGFKAIYSISERVTILSNGYTFRFDKNYFPKTMKPFLWPIILIWTKEIPTSLRSLLDLRKVVFIIDLKPGLAFKKIYKK